MTKTRKELEKERIKIHRIGVKSDRHYVVVNDVYLIECGECRLFKEELHFDKNAKLFRGKLSVCKKCAAKKKANNTNGSRKEAEYIQKTYNFINFFIKRDDRGYYVAYTVGNYFEEKEAPLPPFSMLYQARGAINKELAKLVSVK